MGAALWLCAGGQQGLGLHTVAEAVGAMRCASSGGTWRGALVGVRFMDFAMRGVVSAHVCRRVIALLVLCKFLRPQPTARQPYYIAGT